MTDKRKSTVWNHFVIKDVNDKFATCIHCENNLSRGGNNIKTYSTTNLKKHLMKSHKDVFIRLEESTSDILNYGNTELVPVLLDSLGRISSVPQNELFGNTSGSSIVPGGSISSHQTNKRAKLDTDHPRARKITNCIGEMMCLDLRYISIVEDLGFQKLIECLEPKYIIPHINCFSQTIVPNLYKTVKNEIVQLLKSVKTVSLSVGHWHNDSEFLSITAHFITNDFKMHHACLAVASLIHETNVTEGINRFIEEQIRNWCLDEKIHAVVVEESKNVVNSLASRHHVSSAAHTLQIVVKESCLNQKHILKLSSACRRMIDYFKQSDCAMQSFRKAQITLNLNKDDLLLADTSKWNSTFYMFRRILEQKNAIETALKDQIDYRFGLTSTDWLFLEKVIDVLKVFEQTTETACNSKTNMAEVIPLVNGLIHTLEQSIDNTHLSATKKDIIHCLKIQFGCHLNSHLNVCASLLDPRFKSQVFSSLEAVTAAKAKLLTEVSKEKILLDAEINSSTGSIESEKQSSKETVWNLYNNLIAANRSTQHEENKPGQELHAYLEEPLMPPDTDVIAYWKYSKFQCLKRLAQKYLSTPASTYISQKHKNVQSFLCNDGKYSRDISVFQMILFLHENLNLNKEGV